MHLTSLSIIQRNWLKHCAASRKVAGSFPDRFIGIFFFTLPSGRTMALGLTERLSEMSTAFIIWGKGGRCVELITLPLSCVCCLEILGASTSWSPKRLSRPLQSLFYLSGTQISINYISCHLISCSYPSFNPLNPELNPICYLLALLGTRHFLHVSRIRVKLLTLRLLMSYIYIYDISRLRVKFLF